MNATPSNAIDLAYGFSSATLAGFQASNWKTNYPPIEVGFDMVNGTLVPQPNLKVAQYVFSGSTYALPASQLTATNQFIIFNSAPDVVTVNLAFYGASFLDNTNTSQPVLYTFYGFTGKAPKGVAVVDLTAQPLVVSVPGLLYQIPIPYSSVPQAFQNNLQTLCNGNLPADLSVIGVIANLDYPEADVPSMSAYPNDQSILAQVVAQWAMQYSALQQLVMLYIAASRTPPFVSGVQVAILPPGTIPGTQTSVPPSLLVACSVNTPLPEDIATVVTDSGQLFSINQLTQNGGVPYNWGGAQPTACMALSPTFVADAIFTTINTSSVFDTLISLQLLVGSWGESSHDENWVVRSNLQPPTGGNPNAAASFPTQAANPSLTGGNIVNWQGPSATSTGDGYFSTATLVSSANIWIGWQTTANDTVNLAVNFTVNFQGTEILTSNFSEPNTFYNMSSSEAFGQNCVVTPLTSAPPFPGITFGSPSWTPVWPNPGPSANNETVGSMITTINDIQGFAQTLALQLTFGQLGALFVVGDLGCSLGPPLVDTQYAVNCVLTPSNSSPAPQA